MKTKLITAFWLLLLFAAVAYSSNQTESAPNGRTTGANLRYTAANLPDGALENLTVANNNLTLSPTAVTGRYLSPILDAPIPFSAVVPSWLADVPETPGINAGATSFTLQLRTATADNHWSSWYQIEHNEDWMLPGEEKTIGQMITVSAPDRTHQKFQFALSFGRYNLTAAPVLTELRFDFIDASQGPGAAELAAELAALQAAADENPAVTNGNYPKPPVISRDSWCTDPACDYTDGLTYYPVSHLILHHTATDNSAADWADVVRAIWYYHTIVLEWGDIGYQYLGDMNGNLYEGHLGGDDVIGIHAASANTGSMGLALMGTFSDPDDDPPGISPPPAMMNAAAELFAWKADQKDIDVYDAGMLPNMGWGLPYLSAHRDVDGSTVCPGDQAHLLLPWLRDAVASRIGFVSPHQYIDELSPAFTKSPGPWNVAPYGCGNNGHAFYAWSTTDPGSGLQWGEWRPPVAVPGSYEIEAYIPYCITGAPETYGATYQITHQNGTSAVTVSHDAHVGRWISLGTYQLTAGNGNVIRLTNLTPTDNNQGVWFDAVRLRPIQDTAAPTSLVTNIYELLDGRYRLYWFGNDDSSGVSAYTIQYRAAGSATWINWLVDTTETSGFFDPPDAQTYWFRSQAADHAGNIEPPHPNPGDLNTDQAFLLSHVIMLPVVQK